MAQPGPSSSTGACQGAGAVAEADLMAFIDDYYPNLLRQSHFIPPYHFNNTPQTVQTIAGQTVIVRDNPPSSDPPQQPSVIPPDPQVAGRSGVQYPRASRNIRVQDSDQQDDRATQRCLSALSDLHHEILMVISNLEFKKYLSGSTNPLHAAAIAQLPTTAGSSLPPNIQDGECDVIAIDLVHGIILGEIKSVGDSDYFRTGTTRQQTEMIVKQVQKAAAQLENQEKALRHLVSDLGPVRVTKTLMVPNITSAQLKSALSASPALLQTLCQALFPPNDVTDITRAVGQCLCQDDLGQPVAWWQRLHSAGADPSMTEEIFKRMVARFCGPATTVEVPTPGPPRKVLRSWGQAVAETGLRLSSLVLTPSQVGLLNTQPEPQYMFLEGPPGTGKTICLLLKALQWVRQGRQVVVVSGEERSRAVSLLLKEELVCMEPAAANNIHHLCVDINDRPSDTRAAVYNLQQQLGPDPLHLVVDEIRNYIGSGHIPWLKEVRRHLPDVTVWLAGAERWNLGLTQQPPWLEVWTLQEALRCPPTVTTHLQQSQNIQSNFTLPYIAPQHPVATQGPPVQHLQHEDQPGHDKGGLRQCDRCADQVINIVTNQLRVGQPDHGLQYRDVFILYGGVAPSAGDVMVQRLQEHGLPVRAVTSHPLSEDDTRELALAVSDVIIVADSGAVQGLERRVVIGLSTGRDVRSIVYYLSAPSRCSGALYCID